jgi:hypothetical protein
MIRPRYQFAHQRDKNTQNSLTRAETWPPCARSPQDRELMAQDDKFQQQIKAPAGRIRTAESHRGPHPVIALGYPTMSQ